MHTWKVSGTLGRPDIFQVFFMRREILGPVGKDKEPGDCFLAVFFGGFSDAPYNEKDHGTEKEDQKQDCMQSAQILFLNTVVCNDGKFCCHEKFHKDQHGFYVLIDPLLIFLRSSDRHVPDRGKLFQHGQRQIEDQTDYRYDPDRALWPPAVRLAAESPVGNDGIRNLIPFQ